MMLLAVEAALRDQLGYVAGVITVGAFLPQVVLAWRTRRTRDLSMSTFALLITAGSLWALYGLMASDWPVVATNLGMVSLNLALLVAKLRFDTAPLARSPVSADAGPATGEAPSPAP